MESCFKIPVPKALNIRCSTEKSPNYKKVSWVNMPLNENFFTKMSQNKCPSIKMA